MGKAMMGTGESSGERRAIEAAEAAISNPLLDDVCMKGASGLLVSITGGNDLTLYEVDEAASRVRAEADPDANIIVGATFDNELDGSIRVSVVATGIGLASTQSTRPVLDAPKPAVLQERSRLTERLAGLATLPGPVDLDEPSLVLGQNDVVKEPSVWRAPGNVVIEKRPAQVTGMTFPHAAAPKSAAPQAGSFQHIQRAENGGAAGQIRCIEPVRFATKPGEVGQDRFGSRAIVPVRQHAPDAGSFQRRLKRQ